MAALGLAAMLLPMIAVMAFLAKPGSLAQRSFPERSLSEKASVGGAVAAGSLARVSGSVVDLSGNRAAGAQIRLLVDGGKTERIAQAKDDGTFSFEGIGPGAIRLVADDELLGFAISEELETARAQGVVLVLKAVPDLVGTVRDERGVAIARATVKVWGKQQPVQKLVTTDDEGRFQLRHVPTGLDTISVWAHGFGAVSKRLEGRAREDVRLLPARSIAGIVVDSYGHPVGGAEIAACEGEEVEAAISDGSGEFNLPATTVGCSASARHKWSASARPVLIESGHRLTLEMGVGGAIEGLVVDPRGRPVNSFSVSIATYEPSEGEAPSSGRAGAMSDHLRGTFRLDGLAPGRYSVIAIVDGRSSELANGIEVRRGKVVRGIHLVLADAAPFGEEATDLPTDSSDVPADSVGENTAEGPTAGSDDAPELPRGSPSPEEAPEVEPGHS